MDEHLLPLVIFGNNYRELQADKSPAGKSHCTDWKEKAPCPNTIVQNIKWERSEKHLRYKWSSIERTFDTGVTSIQIFEVERNGSELWYSDRERKFSLIGTITISSGGRTLSFSAAVR